MATILFFYGVDAYRSGQKVRALKQRYIDQSLGDTNLSVLDGATIAFDQLVRQVQALPFLAKARLVVVHDLLLRGKKDLQEQVTAYLDKVPDTTVLVFHESGQPDQRTKLFKRLSQPKLSERFDQLSGGALEAWMRERAASHGVPLSGVLIRELTERIGSNLARLDQELTKLALWQLAHPTDALSSAVLDELVMSETASDVFQLIDALARQDGRRALGELERLLRNGEAELYILSMIVYQYRLLLLVTDAIERGHRSAGDLARLLRIAPFVAEKTVRVARGYTFPQVAHLYKRLLDYDIAIKTGEIEPRLALEMLIAEFVSPSGCLLTPEF